MDASFGVLGSGAVQNVWTERDVHASTSTILSYITRAEHAK